MDTAEVTPSPALARPVDLAETVLRTAEQFCQMNVAATSVMLQAQAQAAGAVGLPDWSAMIAVGSEQTRHMLTIGTDQLVQAAQHADAMACEMQRNTSQMLQDQTARATEMVSTSLDQMGQRARDQLDRVGAWQDRTVNAAAGWTQATADVMERMPRPDLRMAPLSQAVQSALPAGPF
ncbi:hypothetical protein [uncultured Aquabacterium sp.]|uniref:hypothetical protein n=1 Tax=uncultured Aquabacterium sp. TaxID=158753 RepID=UPI0026278007|nr:hypothetical protein [uncultured Aquabacterium sp.]